MAELLTFGSLSALLTLAALEIVLGIDNLVFISILSAKLPKEQQNKARRIGLALAAIGRIVLLFGIAWLVTLEETKPFRGFFSEETVAAAPAEPPPPDTAERVDSAHDDKAGADHGEESFTQTLANLSVKDLILILGGVFLIAKATWEIHHSLEPAHGPPGSAPGVAGKAAATFGGVIFQILMLDLVFSIDSVLTAVGMVNPDEYTSPPFPGTDIPWPPLVVMVSAIVLAIAVMLVFAGPVARFIERHPTIKMLALAFLVMIGIVLVAEGFHQHIPRGYIYSAMAFSLFVDLLQMRQTRHLTKPAEHVAGH